ncbi:MAG: coenzyme F420-0:L-glutamate ligase [Candidatus Bipolaricaulota bacterium]|nr:coenzyme F420-0:L-glutamate ligase [Candidatus Bipolaricaulota bacterium]
MQSQKTMVQFIPISVPEPITPEKARGVTPGRFVLDALAADGLDLRDRDVVVVSSKIVSLFEGRTILLDTVTASVKSRVLGFIFRKDARKFELLSREGRAAAIIPLGGILRSKRARQMLVSLARDEAEVKTALKLGSRFEYLTYKHATYLPEAGIDIMNSPAGYVSLLPEDPSASARSIGTAIEAETGKHVAVIVTDTIAPLGRTGTVDVAIGFSGIVPFEQKLFERDLFGDLRPGSRNLVIDSIAGAAGAIMGQTTEKTPIAVARGMPFASDSHAGGRFAMSDVGYPRRVFGLAAVGVVACTLLYWLLDLVPGRGRRRSP